MAGAVVASIFYVVVLGQRWDHGRSAADLADAVEDNLRSAIVEFDRPLNLDHATGQPTHVANISKTVGEYDDGEWACHLIFAKVQKVNAGRTYFYAEDFAGHTAGFADMLAGLADRDAVGGNEQVRPGQRKGEQDLRRTTADHVLIVGALAGEVCDGHRKMHGPSQNGTARTPTPGILQPEGSCAKLLKARVGPTRDRVQRAPSLRTGSLAPPRFAGPLAGARGLSEAAWLGQLHRNEEGQK